MMDSTLGVTSSFAYGYDKASRLTRTRQQNTDGTCTVRGYGFDKNSNRTGIATATSMSTGATGAGDTTACPAVPALASTGTFDTADRIIDGSVYDAFGRATSTPATASLTGAGQASTQTYYVDDLIRSQTTGAARTTWTLDPAGRFLAATAETNAQPDGSGAWTTASVKTNHYDSTGDSPRWITENAAGTALTRYVDGIDGNLLASTTASGGTVLQLSDIHGDTVLQLPLDTAVAPTALDTDEYGNPTTTARDAQARYGWLGAKQRSVETPTGMTLMGVRVYNPTTGRFLSTDPVPGGGANAYAYPTDPVNGYDLDGQRWGLRRLFRCTNVRCLFFHRDNKHFVMRKRRPGFHWSNHRNRLEWDKVNGWHMNRGKKHYRLRDGVRRVRSFGRSSWSYARRGFRRFARFSAGGLGGVFSLWSSWMPPIVVDRRQSPGYRPEPI